MMYATAASPTLTYHGTARGVVKAPLIRGVQGAVLEDIMSNDEDIHGILNLIAWGYLVDMGIVFIRLFKEKTFSIGKLKVSARQIHSIIMWVTFIMGTFSAALLLNKNRKIRGSALLGMQDRDFHYINGLIMLSLSVMTMLAGILNFLLLEKPRKGVLAKINFNKIHKYLGFATYLGAKANIVSGALFHKEGNWQVPVFIYLGVLSLAHIYGQKKYLDKFKVTRKIRNYDRMASTKGVHIALIEAINNGTP